MLRTKIQDLERIIVFKNVEEKNLFKNAVFLYDAIEHSGYDMSNFSIPIEVASILYMEFKADVNTIISSLIYKVTSILKMPEQEMLKMFNSDIYNKVIMLSSFDNDLSSLNNSLLLIKSITSDVKVTIIKLLERLAIFHQMSEMAFLNETNFIEETLNFYVPIAKLLGIYKIKNNLENACFKYTYNYENASKILLKVDKQYALIMKEVNKLVESECKKVGLSKEIFKFEVNKKSVYDIIRKANEIEQKVKSINKRDYINLLGFCSIKCIADNKIDCYKAIYLLHKFRPILGSFNDYINGLQGNEYRAIHTCVFIKNHVVDFRICTKEMETVNYYGIAALWDDDENLQKRLIEKYDFVKTLVELEKKYQDVELVEEFTKQIIQANLLRNEYISSDIQKSLNTFFK